MSALRKHSLLWCLSSIDSSWESQQQCRIENRRHQYTAVQTRSDFWRNSEDKTLPCSYTVYCIVRYKWRCCPCSRAITNKTLIPFYCKEEPDSIWSKPLVQSLSVTPLVGFYACDSWISKDACCLIFLLVANLQFSRTRGRSWQWQHVTWSGENHLLRPSNLKLRQKRENGKLHWMWSIFPSLCGSVQIIYL